MSGMGSDFKHLHEKYQFNSILMFPTETDLFDWLHDLKGVNLLALDYLTPDFGTLIKMVASSGKAPILAIQNIYTVGEWGSILTTLKQISQNFAISHSGEFGIVEWHQ